MMNIFSKDYIDNNKTTTPTNKQMNNRIFLVVVLLSFCHALVFVVEFSYGWSLLSMTHRGRRCNKSKQHHPLPAATFFIKSSTTTIHRGGNNINDLLPAASFQQQWQQQKQCRPFGSSTSCITTTSLASSTVSSSSILSDGDGIEEEAEDNQSQQRQQDDDENANDNEPLDRLTKPPVEMGTHEELMYALGINLARQLGDITPLVDNGKELAQVAKGLLDTIIGRLTNDIQQEVLLRRGQELNELITERADKIKKQFEQYGRDMLAEMAAIEDTITLDSGVVVQILDHGPLGPNQGIRPTKSSTVKIHYHGTLADGTVFDSTTIGPKGGEPVQFPLAAVIPGWRDGVLQLRKGNTAMIGIPPEQGYGSMGTPDGRIPSNATLFFKIELLDVLSAGIGGEVSLLGADGKTLQKQQSTSRSGLLGVDGKPL